MAKTLTTPNHRENLPSVRLPLFGWCVVALTLALSACGPVQSTSFLIDADIMLEAARTAQAAKNAPYEWTAANLYVAKAREEVGYSDYEQAVDFARKALSFATRARDTAIKVARQNESAPKDP